MNAQKLILVVDDDVQFVDTVKTLLENVGYRVNFAYQPKKGVDLAKQTKPDLILLDAMFAGPPGPDGIETASELTRIPELKNTPVIMISGLRKVSDVPFSQHDEKALPVRAFIEKPVKPDKLLAEIKKVLG